MRPGMEEARRCKYRAIYYDFEAKELREWECDMPALPGREYCLFHDPDCWSKEPEVIRQAFYERIKNAAEKAQAIFCIGYHLPSIDLSGYVFRGRIYFNRAIFHGVAVFYEAEFLEDAVFEFATFHKDASFWSATFSKLAVFRGATFLENAVFIRTRFLGPANFIDAHVHKAASFEFVKFLDDVLFEFACFFKHANFWCAEFSGNVSFRGATFHGVSNFWSVKFHNIAGFDGTTFFAMANFDGAIFMKKAIFYDVLFNGDVSFRAASFYKTVDFGSAHLRSGAVFESVLILDEMKFHESQLPTISEYPLDTRRRVVFKRIRFGARGKIIFLKTDMSRVSLLFVDLSRVEFRGVRWWNNNEAFMTVDAMVFLLKTNRKLANKYKRLAVRFNEKVLDDIALPDDPDITLENILQELRDLRDWHIAKKRYEEAAKFYIAEMEVRRLAGPEAEKRHVAWPPRGLLDRLKERAGFWLEKRLLWLYRATCLYGESLARPVAWLLAIWLLFGFVYAFSGLIAAPGLATALQLLAEGLVFSGSVIVLMLLLRAAPVVAAWGYIAWAEGALALLIYAVLVPTIMRRIWRLVKA